MGSAVMLDDKWCSGCKARHPRSAFGRDRSRSDGLATKCQSFRTTVEKARYVSRATGARPGPARAPARSGDKRQARAFVNRRVNDGTLPAPSTLPCTDCGHLAPAEKPRHEYDHHHGYDAEHHGCVQAVCAPCHHARERARG